MKMADREVQIQLLVSGHQNPDGTIKHVKSDPKSLQYSYQLLSSNPPATGPIVASNGDIDLGYLPQPAGYSDRVDISFTIGGSVIGNDDTNTYYIRAATLTETSGKPNQVGFCWRVNNETSEVPIPWPAHITVKRPDKSTIKIDDQNPGNSAVPYYYCLGTAFDNINQLGGPEKGKYYYLAFDPKIVHG
jgi:hypothetical protein